MITGVGIYGANGHQIDRLLLDHPRAALVAAAAMPQHWQESAKESYPGISNYHSLDEMLLDDRVQLVSLCSPLRRAQAAQAVRCMEAGRHVYAEKPCAMTEEALDWLIETAMRCGVQFHEMAGTAFDEPYLSMSEVVKSGVIGEVVQVFAQKSYPWFDGRPQDEDIDGGIICQAGIHAVRMIEHVAGRKVAQVLAIETPLGNPVAGGGLRMAASFTMKLDNGGVASVIANYLNPRGFGQWGNEHLRIFGTKGFVESTDGGKKTRLVTADGDMGPIAIREDAMDYFDMFINSIQGIAPMPLTLEEELHPTRVVIRAKQSALAGGVFV